jgi:Ca-activated chloride channel family protein
MNKAAFGALVLAILCLLPGIPAFGQGRPRRVDTTRTAPPPAPPQSQTDTSQPADTSNDDQSIEIEGTLIEVPTVVADRSGRYVPQMRKEDFQIFEDGRPQQITFFSSERVPIHVAIVMDTSGSTRGTIGDIQEAAIDFIGQLLPGDQVMLVSFGSDVVVEQEFTNDRGKLAGAVRRTRPNGATKLYEAAYLTVAERLRQIDGRKAMIILSDGNDTASKDVTFDEAVNVCSESDVVVYGIRYPDSSGFPTTRNPRQTGPWPDPNQGPYPPNYPQPRRNGGGRRNGGIRIPGINWPFMPTASNAFPGPQIRINGAQIGGDENDPFMETITANSGGQLYYASAVGNVRGLFAAIAEELRHVYTLGYTPSNPLSKGGYRKISVRVPARSELAVRHRLGYQADAYK